MVTFSWLSSDVWTGSLETRCWGQGSTVGRVRAPATPAPTTSTGTPAKPTTRLTRSSVPADKATQVRYHTAVTLFWVSEPWLNKVYAITTVADCKRKYSACNLPLKPHQRSCVKGEGVSLGGSDGLKWTNKSFWTNIFSVWYVKIHFLQMLHFAFVVKMLWK